jgi:hypothetical protein
MCLSYVFAGYGKKSKYNDSKTECIAKFLLKTTTTKTINREQRLTMSIVCIARTRSCFPMETILMTIQAMPNMVTSRSKQFRRDCQ